MRVVLDTNVLVSALLSRTGAPARLLELWFAGEIEVVVSPALLRELEQTLELPKLRSRVTQAQAQAFLALLGRAAELVEDPAIDPPVRAADPDDDYLVALAAAEHAVLVSGDVHLLDLADRAPVMSPGDLVRRLED